MGGMENNLDWEIAKERFREEMRKDADEYIRLMEKMGDSGLNHAEQARYYQLRGMKGAALRELLNSAPAPTR